MNIPATGANPQKEKFFREVATAFEFLALFYALSAEDQEHLLQFINKLHAGRAK